MIPLVIGIVLVILSSEVVQPPVLNTLEYVIGWLLIVYGIIVILLGLFGGGRPIHPRARRWWY